MIGTLPIIQTVNSNPVLYDTVEWPALLVQHLYLDLIQFIDYKFTQLSVSLSHQDFFSFKKRITCSL